MFHNNIVCFFFCFKFQTSFVFHHQWGFTPATSPRRRRLVRNDARQAVSEVCLFVEDVHFHHVRVCVCFSSSESAQWSSSNDAEEQLRSRSSRSNVRFLISVFYYKKNKQTQNYVNTQNLERLFLILNQTTEVYNHLFFHFSICY